MSISLEFLLNGVCKCININNILEKMAAKGVS
jgi:hypothetical protein